MKNSKTAAMSYTKKYQNSNSKNNNNNSNNNNNDNDDDDDNNNKKNMMSRSALDAPTFLNMEIPNILMCIL